jgi:hypothetical protein
MTKLYARQGDLVIDKLTTPISGELETVRRVTFAGDSSGRPHVILGAAQIRMENGATLLRLSKPRQLVHQAAGGHKPVAMEPGDYQIRSLRERGDGADRNVED